MFRFVKKAELEYLQSKVNRLQECIGECEKNVAALKSQLEIQTGVKSEFVSFGFNGYMNDNYPVYTPVNKVLSLMIERFGLKFKHIPESKEVARIEIAKREKNKK